jgi:uronate dehydrogenase
MAAARALGYQPQDDAEAYAAEIIAEQGEPDPEHDPVLRYLGGEFTLPDAQVPPGLAPPGASQAPAP